VAATSYLGRCCHETQGNLIRPIVSYSQNRVWYRCRRRWVRYSVKHSATRDSGIRQVPFVRKICFFNPFYVQGDFNGDGKLDTAILIKQKATGKNGFAIVHGGSTIVKIFGAGRNFGYGGDDFSWLDAWYTHAKGKVSQGAEEGGRPKLIGDAIMVIKIESASALIYWAGTQYEWYQQG